MKKQLIAFILVFVLCLLTACTPQAELSISASATATATQPAPTRIAPTLDPTPTSTADMDVSLWVCDCLPEPLLSGLEIGSPFTVQQSETGADVKIVPAAVTDANEALVLSRWVYVLAAPFPTIQDGIPFSQIRSAWRGERTPNAVRQLLVSPETLAVLSRIWGEPDPGFVISLPASALLKSAWDSDKAWALLPFEDLDPRWKVMRVDNISPLDGDFDVTAYPLAISIAVVPSDDAMQTRLSGLLPSIRMPTGNFDPDKLTSLIMTGTTALARYTALRMEEKGLEYPARDIVDLLRDADITHISNEVPFYTDCPPAQPVRVEQRFCSDPSYFALLKYIDADVIEMTGNHILDWGSEPLLYTLDLYRAEGLPYFGGGRNLAEAKQALTLQMHGQSLTFIGCSPAGPEVVWARQASPGSNPCSPGWMEDQITEALAAGSIPIVTFQHIEVEDYTPHSSQRIDFQHAAEMGASIVSGSQSHFAQTMTFVGSSFVHYGLGNLFFDQMYGENPKEFVDRHFFYNGKYISTELITLLLEDASKPRLMERGEREAFLQTIFERCDWGTVFQDEN